MKLWGIAVVPCRCGGFPMCEVGITGADMFGICTCQRCKSRSSSVIAGAGASFSATARRAIYVWNHERGALPMPPPEPPPPEAA